MEECCAASAISKLWRDILPPQVRAQVAALDLKTQWDEALRTADLVYKTTTGRTSLPGATATPVAAVTTAVNDAAKALKSVVEQVPADLDTSADNSAFQACNQLAGQLAAFGRNFNGGRGKNNNNRSNSRRPYRGGNNNNYNSRSQPRQPAQNQGRRQNTGQPHPDGPPETACPVHWQWGRSAYYCAGRAYCLWKDNISPRPNNNSNNNQ